MQAYTSDSYRERLIAGEAWAALGWSGDLLQADSELPKLTQANRAPATPACGSSFRPAERCSGSTAWSFRKRAKTGNSRHAFINYLLDPAVAALNAQKVNYATPNEAARLLLPPAMLADESIYPPAELLARCSWLENRGPDIEKIERLWRVALRVRTRVASSGIAQSASAYSAIARSGTIRSALVAVRGLVLAK